MIRSSLVKSVCVAIALSGFSAPAGAIDLMQGSPAAGLGDGLITKVVVVHRGVTGVGPRGGVYHRGATWGARPGYGYGYHGGVVRPGAYGYHGGAYRWGGWARPGGYWWPAGGAIAAGAAIGVLAAGAAVAYAGQPPGPGLCWYYTNPGYNQGFWDAC
jgi:hypothetical protein